MAQTEPGPEAVMVVTGDVARSRELPAPDRRELQRKMLALLEAVNKDRSADFVAPFSLSGGDEFQAALKPDAELFGLIRRLQAELFPVELRFGIGIGGVSTDVRPRSQEMDGEAFARSREAMEAAKQNRSEVWFRTASESFDLAANTICRLMTAIRSDWSEVQHRRLRKKLDGWTNEEIAEAESVSPQAVSRSLLVGHYDAVREAEANLEELRGCRNALSLPRDTTSP
ncbi:MAG: SatD family protein [Planctomycetota bacterium]